MKKDMRITYPLWQMGGGVLLVAFVFFMNEQRGFGNMRDFIFLGLCVYIVFFSWNITKHNKEMPKHKIRFFTMTPQEYLEDDELFQEVTKRAAKKVYSYFNWSLPLFAGLSLGSKIGTEGMVIGILFLSMGQYLIYYKEMRKYVGGDE